MANSQNLKSQVHQELTVSVAGAKANLSSILLTVEKKQTEVIVLRRGRPIARIVPLADTPRKPLHGSMAGRARELKDITSVHFSDEWTPLAL